MDTKIDYSWQKNSACKGMDIELFYPAHGKSPSRQLSDVCENCPVFDDCLDHALRYEEYGHWANTGPKDRREMRIDLGIELITINTDFLANQYAEEIAKMEATATATIKGRGRKVAQCGTRSGYGAHRRKGETPCEACRSAQNESVKKFNKAKREDQRDREMEDF